MTCGGQNNITQPQSPGVPRGAQAGQDVAPQLSSAAPGAATARFVISVAVLWLTKGQGCHKEFISQEKQAEPLISLMALRGNIRAALLSESSFSQLREEQDSTLTTCIK